MTPLLFAAVLWVGHACLWTYVLNVLYGMPLPKQFLKPWRWITGFVIAGGAVVLLLAPAAVGTAAAGEGDWGGGRFVLQAYLFACSVGCSLFLITTVRRLLRKKPVAVLAESTRTLDVWHEHGEALIGDGKWNWLPRLPLNGVFRVDFTSLTLAIPQLPPAWDGLTVLLLSDFHFHGTPSKLFYERVIDEIDAEPPPDVVALAGDYLDTDDHHPWIPDLLGRLKWAECGLAILGNHDAPYGPDRARGELAKLGFRVVSDRWEEVSIRGVPCVAVGHEGPWFKKVPDLSAAPRESFRLCLSHTPDNLYWGAVNGIDLMLCGHVHGGQVRVPVVGSIFVPSVYSRRFDQGVFESGGTTMVVGRGLSGKEPLRFRCNPQVIRITLRPG